MLEQKAPETVVSLKDPDKLRQEVREKAKKSLYFLAKAVIGFHDMTPELHLPVCNFVQDRNNKRELLVLPRGHFKSSIVTISYPIWLLINNPNERIMIQSSTATNAEKFLHMIKDIFENNQLFKWAFPELLPDLSSRSSLWNQQAINVNRPGSFPDPSIDTVGVGGKVAGRHCTVKIGDDLIGEQAASSDVELDATLRWFDLSEALFENPGTGIDRQVSTRWHHTKDIAAHIEATDKRYIPMIRSAIEDGKPLFPQRFTMEVLEELRERKPRFFSQQYMNNPMSAEDVTFRMEWLKYYTVNADGLCVFEDGTPSVKITDLFITLRLDPALATDNSACRSAFVVDGTDAAGRIILLDVVAKRLAPPATLEEMYRLNAKWHPQAVGIEEVLFQSVFKHWLMADSARRGISIPIRKIKTSTQKSKEDRIEGMSNYFSGGMVYVLRGMHSFIEEYSLYPMGNTKDILDAFSYGPQLWRKPTQEERSLMPDLSKLDFESRRYWESVHRKRLGLDREPEDLETVLNKGTEEPLSELLAN